jgi:hypothetical protein
MLVALLSHVCQPALLQSPSDPGAHHPPGRARRQEPAYHLPSCSAAAPGGHRRRRSRTTALDVCHSPAAVRGVESTSSEPRSAPRTCWGAFEGLLVRLCLSKRRSMLRCDRRRTASPCSPCMPRTVCSEAHVLDTDEPKIPPIRFGRLHPSALEPTAPSPVPSAFRIDCARHLAGLAKWARRAPPTALVSEQLPSAHSSGLAVPTYHTRGGCLLHAMCASMSHFPSAGTDMGLDHSLAPHHKEQHTLLRTAEAHQTSTASSRPNQSVGKFEHTHTHTPPPPPPPLSFF